MRAQGIAQGIGVDGRGARVVVLTRYFPPEYTGAGIQLAAVVERLRRRGVAFTVLTSTAGPRPAEAPEGTRVVHFRTPRNELLRDWVFGLRATWWLLRHPGWDLLHTIDFSYQTLGPLALARLRGRPVLVKTTLLDDSAARSAGARLLRAVRRLGYRGADAVVALSDALEAQLRCRFGVREGILRIPNGVDTDRFRPPAAGERGPLRRELGLPEAAFVPVLCGMRIPRKNAVALVSAAALMVHRPVHVLLVGPPGEDAGYEARLRAAVAALPEGTSASVLGDRPADEVARLLRACDVCVLPSRGEGMPNSLLEGMATGLACVATDIPGSRDVLAKGGGLLVPLDDDDALAVALDRLARDPEARRSMGETAHAVVRERYALDRVAARYGETYAALLGARGPGGTRGGRRPGGAPHRDPITRGAGPGRS